MCFKVLHVCLGSGFYSPISEASFPPNCFVVHKGNPTEGKIILMVSLLDNFYKASALETDVQAYKSVLWYMDGSRIHGARQSRLIGYWKIS